MAVTYFGRCNSDGSLDITPLSGSSSSNTLVWNVGAVYTCPGSGAQRISDVGVYIKGNVAHFIRARLAIYETDLTTILAYTTNNKLFTGFSDDWLTWTASELTVNAGLIGGVDYSLCLAYTGANGSISPMYQIASAKCDYIASTDYVTSDPAFPSPIPTATGDYGAETAIRVGVGVEPASRNHGFFILEGA